MKTAMQELIEVLKKDGLELFGMEEYLEKEKQQIIDAWDEGNVIYPVYSSSETYYNETFKND